MRRYYKEGGFGSSTVPRNEALFVFARPLSEVSG